VFPAFFFYTGDKVAWLQHWSATVSVLANKTARWHDRRQGGESPAGFLIVWEAKLENDLTKQREKDEKINT
jgi:hypothetical protein